VGINLAIQDAVAAANILAVPLRAGQVTDLILKRVQQRREFPTRVTQFLLRMSPLKKAAVRFGAAIGAIMKMARLLRAA